MRPRFFRSLIVAVGAAALAVGPAAAASRATDQAQRPPEISVTLEGDAIDPQSAKSWPCHDFEYPVIRCFTSSSRMFADLEGYGVQADARLGANAMAASPYVVAFDLFFYGGSNPKVLSTDQPWLFTIGWNDVTSSFKSHGATGRWREHSPAGGFVYSFSSTTQVAVLNSTYNNKFSAFEID